MPFKRGESGNPAGLKPGTRRVSRLQSLLKEHGEEVVTKILELANAGDTTLLKFVGDKLIPSAKHETVTFDLDVTQSKSQQADSVLLAVSQGVIPPEVGHIIIQDIRASVEIHMAVDLAEELEASQVDQRRVYAWDKLPTAIKN